MMIKVNKCDNYKHDLRNKKMPNYLHTFICEDTMQWEGKLFREHSRHLLKYLCKVQIGTLDSDSGLTSK